MDKATRQGMEIPARNAWRRLTLTGGCKYDDFHRELQEMVHDYCLGEVWGVEGFGA